MFGKLEFEEVSLEGLMDDESMYLDPIQNAEYELFRPTKEIFQPELPSFESLLSEKTEIPVFSQNTQPIEQPTYGAYPQYPYVYEPLAQYYCNPIFAYPPCVIYSNCTFYNQNGTNNNNNNSNILETEKGNNNQEKFQEKYSQRTPKKSKNREIIHDNSTIHLNEKYIFGKAFLNRKYVYAENPKQKVSRNELRFARVEGNKVFVDDEEIIWDRKREEKINTAYDRVELDGKSITWQAFLKRKMAFIDTKQELSVEEKSRAVIENGKAFVDGRETIWLQVKRKRKDYDPNYIDETELALTQPAEGRELKKQKSSLAANSMFNQLNKKPSLELSLSESDKSTEEKEQSTFVKRV